MSLMMPVHQIGNLIYVSLSGIAVKLTSTVMSAPVLSAAVMLDLVGYLLTHERTNSKSEVTPPLSSPSDYVVAITSQPQI